MLTKQMAEHLAALASLLRGDLANRTGCTTWDAAGIMSKLAEVKSRPAEDVCLAVIRAAVDQHAKTPGVIPADGKHWKEKLSTDRAPRNPLPHEECVRHVGQYAHTCSPCHAERLEAAYQPPRATATPPPDVYRKARKGEAA